MLIKHSLTKRHSRLKIALATFGLSWCLLFFACNQAPNATDEQLETWRPTLRGHYKVSLYPSNPPIRLGQLHSWIIELRDSHDIPITPKHISVSGGMPSHKHGLSTTPRVTEMLDKGQFRIEGMKFHMPGEWVLNLGISGPPGQDIFQLELIIKP